MLQTARTREENEFITYLVMNLVKINLRTAGTDDTLLHLCVSKLNTIRSSYFMDEDPVVSNFKICDHFLRYFQVFCSICSLKHL